MPKKISGQGTLYNEIEYKMFVEVEDGYLIPASVKKISREQFKNIQKREGGYFLEGSERQLNDDDLPEITKRLKADESRPVILSGLGITETTLGNFLQKHFGTKKINDARFLAKTKSN